MGQESDIIIGSVRPDPPGLYQPAAKLCSTSGDSGEILFGLVPKFALLPSLKHLAPANAV